MLEALRYQLNFRPNMADTSLTSATQTYFHCLYEKKHQASFRDPARECSRDDQKLSVNPPC